MVVQVRSRSNEDNAFIASQHGNLTNIDTNVITSFDVQNLTSGRVDQTSCSPLRWVHMLTPSVGLEYTHIWVLSSFIATLLTMHECLQYFNHMTYP